jgi:hypothetical protein
VSGQDRSHVSLQAYPARDASFAREVHDVIDAVSAEAAYDDARIGDLEAVVQARLRDRYPNATVHAQDRFAQLRDPDVMLYAYRDGRIRVEDPRRERLYRALADARVIQGESRRIVGESKAVMTMWSDRGRSHPMRDPGEDVGDVSPSRPLPPPEGSALPDR